MMIKFDCAPFWIGMGLGVAVGMAAQCMMQPKRHKMRTEAGRVMENMCGKVDDAVHHIRCVIQK